MAGDEAVQHLLDGFLASLPGVVPLRALWVHGSLALGDFQAGRSDLDLVAVLDGPITDPEALQALHRSLEASHPLATGLHCSYVQVDQLADASRPHPTWAQQRYFERPVGAVTRRELELGDLSLYGPAPTSLLPATSDAELVAFIRDDLENFWYPASAKRKPWLADIWVDLGLITVARARVTLTDGRLITKREALDLLPSLGAPLSVVQDITHRRYSPAAAGAASAAVGAASASGSAPASGGVLWPARRGFLARRFVRSAISDLLR
ncbi:hypothetical protein [Kribbella sp. NPDC023855]|uniref:hypothetical protein n=1 Tax=Kribbella sp. NPDC023855 TaxID=3154698 RepID=UPI0033C1132E